MIAPRPGDHGRADGFAGVDRCGPGRASQPDQTGQSNIQILKEHGLRAGPALADRRGDRAGRARLKPAAGEPTLRVHARCGHLIERSSSTTTRRRTRARWSPSRTGRTTRSMRCGT